jgi:hypothetical protein
MVNDMVVILDVAPPVLFEPCQAFTVDPAGACSECGWLEEDH